MTSTDQQRAAPPATTPLDALLDIHRVRQYFGIALDVAALAANLRADAAFVAALRRAMLPLPGERRRRPDTPFDTRSGRAAVTTGRPTGPPGLPPGRLAVVASGGSGAMACVLGVARALEEAGRRPDVYSLCSGSALFGFPLAAGLTAREAADLVLGLQPQECADVAWGSLARLPLRWGRGWTGLVRGDRVEAYFRRRLGDRTLGELAVPAYAPIWNVERNELAYLGPTTYPDVTVATAIRMAVSMPLLFEPVRLGGGYWCDGGIVDILPVRPVLDLEPPCPTTVVVHAFHPPGFRGEDATGWERRPASILRAASQVRTAQHIELARENLARLRAAGEVLLVEPLAYGAVRGTGFYAQFLDTRAWPGFMRAGYDGALRVFADASRHEAAGTA